MDYRIERDSMGEIAVDAERQWGAQTQRSLENFPIGTETMPTELLLAFAELKYAAARANHALGVLDGERCEAICAVCREILDAVLPVDLELNRMGWGIDLAFSHVARIKRMLVLVDDRVRVVHPKGTGYNREAALAQMRRWHASTPGYTSPRHFRPLRDEIRYL